MINVTSQMFSFKEAVRHSWNTYFAGSSAPESPETQEDFASIEQSLFRTIVVRPSGLKGKLEEYRTTPMPWLIVRPRSGLTEWPVQFGARDAHRNIVWRMRESFPVTEHVEAEFYDFFDWSPYGSVDLAYVRARGAEAQLIASKGPLVLVEHQYCEFYIKE